MTLQIRLLVRAQQLYLAAHCLAAQRAPDAHLEAPATPTPHIATLHCGCEIARKFRLAQAKYLAATKRSTETE